MHSDRSDDHDSRQQVEQGVANTKRLLPLARQFTLLSLRECQGSFGIRSAGFREAESSVEAVDSVLVDDELGEMAEVDDEHPGQIRIGPDYALYLTNDDEVILLLGHELTHVAAWDGRLREFIDSVAGKVERLSGVHAAEEQKEDLACDYIGEQALKRFIRQHPTGESAEERLAGILGFNADDEDDGDEEHLSQREMLQVWGSLDEELRTLNVR
jgi:hypothetical protein